MIRRQRALPAPPPGHALGLVGAGGCLQAVADRFANGFDKPADLEEYLHDRGRTEAYPARLARAAGSPEQAVPP